MISTVINETDLYQIYGTIENLEDECPSARNCWSKINDYKFHNSQKPYRPYIGKEYQGLMFCGINLNDGNKNISAIEELVDGAIKEYLIKGKYKIFKHPGYGGSPFFYYVPLLSYLFNEYKIGGVLINNEQQISFSQIIKGYDYCAFTNLIKCSVKSPDNRSTPSKSMFENCSTRFLRELDILKCQTLVTFTKFSFPELIKICFKGYTKIYDKQRYSIYFNGNYLLAELEQPLSTQVSRKEKFQTYSEAMYYLINKTTNV